MHLIHPISPCHVIMKCTSEYNLSHLFEFHVVISGHITNQTEVKQCSCSVVGLADCDNTDKKPKKHSCMVLTTCSSLELTQRSVQAQLLSYAAKDPRKSKEQVNMKCIDIWHDLIFYIYCGVLLSTREKVRGSCWLCLQVVWGIHPLLLPPMKESLL